MNKIHHVNYDELPVVGIGKTNERSYKRGRVQRRYIDKDADYWYQSTILCGTQGPDSVLYGPDAIREEP